MRRIPNELSKIPAKHPNSARGPSLTAIIDTGTANGFDAVSWGREDGRKTRAALPGIAGVPEGGPALSQAPPSGDAFQETKPNEETFNGQPAHRAAYTLE